MRRVVAFAVDFAPLWVLGWLPLYALHDWLAASYPWPRLAGLPAVVLYRGLCQARYGRTPGQRLLGLRVADRRGQAPSVLQSLVRNTLLTTPLVLNGFAPPGVSLTSIPWMLFATLMVFGLGGGILYTFLFNRGTRLALHDWLCGTFVWQAESRAPEAQPRPLPRIHSIVVGLIALSCVVWPLVGAGLVSRGVGDLGLRPLLDFREGLLAQGRFRDVGVSYRTFYTPQRTTRVLDITLVGSFPKDQQEAIFTEITGRVRASTGALPQADLLVVTLSERCDLFVSSYSTTTQRSFPLSEAQ